MKMTLHIDEALLRKVMAVTGASSKTRAVDLALREVARRADLQRLAAKGLGLTPDQLAGVFDPEFDLEATRVAAAGGAYGRKPGAG